MARHKIILILMAFFLLDGKVTFLNMITIGGSLPWMIGMPILGVGLLLWPVLKPKSFTRDK